MAALQAKREDGGASMLPNQPSPIIGRQRELQAIRRWMVDQGVRLLTLTGPAGTGKTRLALAAAEALAEDFPDGAVLVELAPFGDWRLVLPAIARAAGVEEGRRDAVLEAVVGRLDGNRLLLILDNFEHVLGAAEQIAELLGACPALRILATSREPLHLTWEQTLPVPPLELADTARGATPEQVAAAPAVALYVQRASTVFPDFALTSENWVAVAEICARLDGLPLAIELAAARSNVLPPQAMVARLDRRLELLKGGPRDQPPRHRALRTAIDWSYDLLDATEQAVFQRLSVFATGCTLAAAAAACGIDPADPVTVLDVVAALVDKSLLHRESRTEGEPRFRMLETVREYALERLAASGDLEDTARRACLYYVEFADEAASQILGAGRDQWPQRLMVEYGNLRVALRWLASHGMAHAALRLAASLTPFWSLQGYEEEGRMWLSSLLALPEAADAPVERAAAQQALADLERDWTGQATEGKPAALAAPATTPSDGLTARELEVLRLIARGLTNKQIAGELYLSVPTVQTHLANIFRKIDVHSRAAATAFVLRHDLGRLDADR